MTSMPASRRARAMIFAPRSCPSRPGLATTTRIFLFVAVDMSGCAALGRRGLGRLIVLERDDLRGARPDTVFAKTALADGRAPPSRRLRMRGLSPLSQDATGGTVP